MRKRSDGAGPSPGVQALAACAVGTAGICAGLFYFIPIHEGAGTLWTMFCAVVTGIYYTRYTRIRKNASEKKR